MESIIPVLIAAFFLAFLANKLNKKDEEPDNHQSDTVVSDMYNHQNDKEMDKEQNLEKQDTLGLMFSTLNELGCQPQANDDGTLFVQYQGECFHMEFSGMYARIWDPMWAKVKADNPKISIILEAVNSANFGFGPTVVLTPPNDEGVIDLHSRRDIMLHPACPDNTSFVKDVLDSFFDTKELVRTRFQQINARQTEEQKNRRPVGFTTGTSSDS